MFRVETLCELYVNETLSAADLGELRRVTLDETSRAKGHEYVTLFADADQDPARQPMIFVAEGTDTATVDAFEANLRSHHGEPSEIVAISFSMSPGFISAVREHLPHAQITDGKFHVIAHSTDAMVKTRGNEQKLRPSLTSKHWALLKGRTPLSTAQRAELDIPLTNMTTTRTARAPQYRDGVTEILTRKRPHVARLLLNRWCSNVLHSKAELMKESPR